jgi:hypothetical protein
VDREKKENGTSEVDVKEKMISRVLDLGIYLRYARAMRRGE